jgi:phosphoribosylformimino-5-aminoimidazole carboxamide ribonucleotide (ProFAR) isomerase
LLPVTESLYLLPAVDVQGGQAVQLTQGVAGSEKSSATRSPPPSGGRTGAPSGCTWSTWTPPSAAARTPTSSPRSSAQMDLNVELSGGIRDDASLERALATGCRRVNIGTAALENPSLVREGHRRARRPIGIAIDVRGTRLAARGWVREGGDWAEAIDRLSAAGCRTFVVTDVNSDGMLTGPNLDPAARRGGTDRCRGDRLGRHRQLDDLRALRELVPLGVTGAIIGTALYVGNFTLADALDVAQG